jgi:ribosomal protein L40E
MDKRDYYEYIKEHQDAHAMAITAVVCPKCGEESGYRAEKCEKCGLVFERGTIPHDFTDRCPKCSYSKEESLSKEAGGKGGGGKE